MNNDYVVIEDTDVSEDEPGPIRKLKSPKSCKNEALWFKEEYLLPSGQVKDSSISSNDTDLFKDLIWNKPHDRMVPGYGMTPGELACVPSDGRRGWLVSSHFFWMSQCLNKQDPFSRFFVFDAHIKKESVDKLLPISLRGHVTTLSLVMSVGRGDDGVVFFGTDTMEGDHWAVAVIDLIKGNVFYCDTLGWPAPKNLLISLIKYTRFSGLVHSDQLTLKMAHEPNEEQHLCTTKCTNYPLQTCSDICGVIALICIAVAALDKKLFGILMGPLSMNMHLYLREPSKYSVYLRYVLMVWMAKQFIDISKVSLKGSFDPYTPQTKLNSNSVEVGTKRSIEEDPLFSGKRFTKNRNCDKVSVCILQNANEEPDRILTEAAIVATELKATISYWKNICKNLCFNNSIEICQDQLLSMAEYQQELKKKINNPLTCYNGHQRSEGEYKNFLYVIQTDYQKEMLKTYSRQCVCVDWLRKSEEAGIYFNLLTMSVFVEGLYEIPVAWMIFNKNDPSLHSYLYNTVSKNVGNIETDIFVGDIQSESYNHWLNYFAKPKRKMFDTSDILLVMNSRAKSRIANEQVLKKVNQFLSVLPHITDRNAFEIFNKAFLHFVKEHSPDLFVYFKEKFFDKAELWASCYRVIPAASFVPFVEPFKHTLKAINFFQSGKNERVDVCIHKLLQFVMFLKRKLFIEMSVIKRDQTLKGIQILHQQSLGEVEFYQSMSGDEWHLKITDNKLMACNIIRGVDDCQCALRCNKCNICIHKFICTCVDYVLNDKGCPHIHHLCKIQKMNHALNGEGNSSFLNHQNNSHLKRRVMEKMNQLSEADDFKLEKILKILNQSDN